MAEQNQLLAVAPQSERAQILRIGQDTSHSAGEVLYQPGGRIKAVYFPRTAVASVVTDLEDGKEVEAATVGREGIVGLPRFLRVANSSHRLIIQVPGDSLRVEAEEFLRLLPGLPVLSEMIGRYAEAVMVLMSQSAACIAMHPVQERCARWFLMTADRTGSSVFHLTHEFLASMLGVHRPTVTIAAGVLQQAGLVEYHRGKVQILDREGLERAACECYRRVQDRFDQLLSQNSRGER
jgi:CRP-like cAMP-binding protein